MERSSKTMKAESNPQVSPGAPRSLPRAVGFLGSTAIVVGTIIGSGIFLVPHDVARQVGSVRTLMLVWIPGGVLALGGSFWICGQLKMPGNTASPWLAPVAFFSIITGLFLIVSRKRAVSQVLAFLVLENGIYTFGVSAAVQTPFLFEVGVLLDVFVAVFVMGITIFHINRKFDHINTDRLSQLKG